MPSSEPSLTSDVHTYCGQPWSVPLRSFGNFVSPLQEHALATPSAPFLTEVGHSGSGTVSYREAHESVAGSARALQNRGVGPGDRVALLPLNNALSVLTILAVAAAGATAVLLSRTDPVPRLQEQMASVGSCVLVDCGSTQAVPGVPVVEAAELNNAGARCEGLYDWPADPQAPAVIMFTTGTTSSSKAVVQTHGNVALNSGELARHHRLDGDARLLGVLPVHYANGLEFTVVATMIAGGHVLLLPEFDAFGYLAAAERYRATLASVVPGMLDAIIDGRSLPELSSLRYFASAAAPLAASTARRVHERLSRRVIQGYGLTETTNFSTITPAQLSDEGYRRWVLEADIPSAGAEVFGNEVAVLDESYIKLSDGEVGEICMRGHSVMAGYYGNLEATAEAFRGGWFHSGDLGYFSRDEETDRRLLTITGRLKNMIKSSGRALSLDEMDRELRALPGVADVVALPVPDRHYGELPAIVLVVAPGREVPDSAVRDALSRRMPTRGLPILVQTVAEIPRTANGKIPRQQLATDLFPDRHGLGEGVR